MMKHAYIAASKLEYHTIVNNNNLGVTRAGRGYVGEPRIIYVLLPLYWLRAGRTTAPEASHSVWAHCTPQSAVRQGR